MRFVLLPRLLATRFYYVRPVAAALGAFLLGGASRRGALGAQAPPCAAARPTAPRDSARDSASHAANRDPERAAIVTCDVANFWRAYAAARRAP